MYMLLISRFTNNTFIKFFHKSFTWRYWLNLVMQTLIPCSLLHFYMFCHTNLVLSKLLKLAKKKKRYKTKICRKEEKRCLNVPLTLLLLPFLFLYPQCFRNCTNSKICQATVEQLWRFLQRKGGELHFFQAWHKHACHHLLHWNASHNLISHINFFFTSTSLFLEPCTFVCILYTNAITLVCIEMV